MSEDSKAWQQRTELLLGKDKTDRLRQAHVLVVGLGGVGAYAAEMICRAGVGRMTIVDADTVQPSNINRQLPATHSSLGRSLNLYGLSLPRLAARLPAIRLYPAIYPTLSNFQQPATVHL